MALLHPCLSTSNEAVELTLETESKIREEDKRLSVGQDVLVFSSMAVSHSATIHKVLDNLKYDVKWKDDPSDHNKYRFPKERILTTVDLTKTNPTSLNVLDKLGALRNYTTVFDVTFGHRDSFTPPSDKPVLENKVSFPLGEPDPSIGLDLFMKNGKVPPGCLAYPRYKVATLSFASSDVELHCLHSDVHFGARQSKNDRFARGSWLRQSNDHPLFFPEGAALLDW